jgi:outer membrane protein OmpA-like peptidoglycan-associated protein
MRPIALALFLMAIPASGQEELPGDKGPPYTFSVRDIVFKVIDIGGQIVDFGGKVEDIAVKETDTEVRIDLAADVLFDFDKAELLPKAQDTLQKAAEVVKQKYKGGTIRIEGHTDAKGSDAYNQKLSLRRADSVKKWFASHGLGTMKFSTEGFGAKKPVAPNQKTDGSDDQEGRQKNRRVEIVIRK